MKRLVKRIHQGNKGFTLIELLIVIAIIGILVAVVLPNVTGLIGHGETEGAKAEKVTIQTAVDTMMAKTGTSTITNPVTEANATSDMSAYPSSTEASQQLYPNYMRTATAKGTYWCTSSGEVKQKTTGY